jgi:hypothetical protein
MVKGERMGERNRKRLRGGNAPIWICAGRWVRIHIRITILRVLVRISVSHSLLSVPPSVLLWYEPHRHQSNRTRNRGRN